MNSILTDPSNAALIRANRTNLYEFFRHFETSSFFDFSRSDELLRWSCPFQHPWFNAILCSRGVVPSDEAYIEDSLAYFKARNTSDINLWLEDGVDPAGWESLLIAHGFTLEDGPSGMSVDLDRLKEGGNLPTGSEIRMVEDAQGVQDCATAMVNGYGFPPEWKDNTLAFLNGLGLDAPFRSYVAYWDGRPVSTAAVFLGREVAGIYNVATVPGARGKGFGAAVTLAPLLDARKKGYRVGTLQASNMGYPVYKEMGFQQDYRVRSFFYTF